MVHPLRLSPLLAALVLLGACTSIPTGPGVLVLPGTGKSFDQFRADESECRQYASGQVGGTTAEQAATDSGVKSAAIGTAVGAAAGALIGGRDGAGVGAGTGLIFGAAAGSGAAQGSGRGLQQRYDFGFQQCMYAKGHRIPVSGRFESSRQPAPPRYSPPPPASAPSGVYAPPPPPGSPPPAPPGIVR